MGNAMPAWLTVARRRALACALLGVVALLLAVRHFAAARTPAASPLAEAPLRVDRAPARLVTVHVVGAVHSPGLYRLREGSRVADAVGRAGGATRRADLSLINLAAPLADGLQVAVPRRERSGAGGGTGDSFGQAAGPVHLNTATLEELDALPGVGPVTAQKIIEFREQNGGFTSVDDLDAVAGIGPARLESLREVVAP